MRLRNVIAIVIAVLVAAACIRLGIWQLDRHEQRAAINELAIDRMTRAPIRTLSELPADTGAARYRPVELSGTYDFENEFILVNRTSRGSPGVNLITPLRLPGETRAVLVNRGWVYAPDGGTVETTRWREPSETVVRGYLLPLPSHGDERGAEARSVRRLDLASMSQRTPYPLAEVIVVDTSTAERGSSTPGRLGAVALDDGPHLGYAMQWFSFAAIAVVGVGIMVWRDRRRHDQAPESGVVRAGMAG